MLALGDCVFVATEPHPSTLRHQPLLIMSTRAACTFHKSAPTITAFVGLFGGSQQSVDDGATRNVHCGGHATD
jgi:hypothetical protein